MEQTVKPKVFLSYAYQDTEKISFLKDALKKHQYDVFSDFDLLPGDKWAETVKYRLQTSDIIMVLITPSLFQNEQFNFQYEDWFIDIAKQRNIVLIPVVVEKTEIPTDFLKFQIVDLTGDREQRTGELMELIDSMSKISFDRFTGRQFEEMTFEMLKALDFKNIKREGSGSDRGVDFIAEYFKKDPFGRINKEVWMIETKYYKESRFDIQTIKKIVELYKYIQRGDAKLLLITNSQLTSIVKKYLEEIQATSFMDIEIIDGLELKNIIAKHPAIQHKFFNV